MIRLTDRVGSRPSCCGARCAAPMISALFFQVGRKVSAIREQTTVCGLGTVGDWPAEDHFRWLSATRAFRSISLPNFSASNDPSVCGEPAINF